MSFPLQTLLIGAKKSQSDVKVSNLNTIYDTRIKKNFFSEIHKRPPGQSEDSLKGK